MSSANNLPFGSGGVAINLSPESQKDLEDVLNETVSPQEKWVEENRRDLFRAFARGRKADPNPLKNIEVLVAVEGTEKDLRHTLVSILILSEWTKLTPDKEYNIREIRPVDIVRHRS